MHDIIVKWVLTVLSLIFAILALYFVLADELLRGFISVLGQEITMILVNYTDRPKSNNTRGK
jgi:hypothetical protein